MQRLARIATRLGPRCAFGVAAYWAANIALLLAEARWHVLSRLTLFDIAQLKVYGSVFAKLIQIGVAGTTSSHL